AEGGVVSNTGTFDDPQGRSSVTHLDASVGDVSWNNTTGTWKWSLPVTNETAAPVPVTITVYDTAGKTRRVTFTYTVSNAGPTATITGAPSSVPERTAITLGSKVTDPGVADTHTLAWAVTKDGDAYDTGSGSSFSFTPDDNGSYVVTLTVT